MIFLPFSARVMRARKRQAELEAQYKDEGDEEDNAPAPKLEQAEIDRLWNLVKEAAAS